MGLALPASPKHVASLALYFNPQEMHLLSWDSAYQAD